MDVAPVPATSLHRVRALVARARTRIRLQGALEGATTSSILASAGALGSVFAVRLEAIAPATGIGLIAASGGVIAVGALLGALRKLDDEDIARRVDRASGLSDRLSTAIAFDRMLRSGKPVEAIEGGEADEDTRDLMRAAIRDAVNVVPRADVAKATPIRRPTDLYTALAFAGVAAIAAGLAVPIPPRDPRLIGLDPPAAKAGTEVAILGERLCGPKAVPDEPCALEGAMVYLEALPLDVKTAPPAALGGSLAIVGALAASETTGVTASITEWTGERIVFTVPAGARLGPSKVVVWAKGKEWGSLPFRVLHPKEAGEANTVALDPDDEAYMRELVADLKAAGDKDQIEELQEYAAKIEKLLDQAEMGELTKEQLLEELKKAEQALNEHSEPDQAEVNKDLAETGKELQKNELTKELGEALAKNELDKAKQELEKLADKMDKGELTEKQQQELAKTMEQVAQQFEKKQEQRDDKAQQEIQKQEDQVRKLEKERDQAKTPEERQEAERRLEKEKRDLQELKKKQDDKEQSAQRESLKRLHKDMDKAAKQLQQKPEENKDEKQQQQENQKQASRSLKDIADETGKVDQDQRKQAAQKKVSSQMDDLREAMRRAKQRGQRGPQNPFGKNNKGGKQQDFAKRAGGGKGQKGAWKPGQGQGQGGKDGQGKDGQQNGGQGDQPPDGPSNTYGEGHDPNNLGDATAKSGNTTDEDVSGVHGKKGSSRRETILSAAQKGFASAKYREVYTDYKKQVEEVMRSEKVPSSYKYYVKKYFTKIKPHAMD